MNKSLIEVFLNYCKQGISIDLKTNLLEQPTKFLSKFDYKINDNKFVIFNELEENEIFIINNLENWEVKEYDDYVELKKNEEIIYIEEMI